MNELRILFTRTDDALTYRLTNSWGGDISAPQPFKPFLTDDDYEDTRWYLEEYMDLPIAGAQVRAQRIEQSLGEWGKRLFDSIFDKGDHRELYNTLVDGEAPRLLTIGTRDLDVLRLPWELIADARGPLTRRGVTIRRQLETAGKPVKYQTGKLPLRILLAVSRPDDAGFIDPRHTTRAMLEALAPLGDGVVVDFCRPATLRQMKAMLTAAEHSKQPYHVVHFDGHGTFLPGIQSGALCFETDTIRGTLTDEVRADVLGAALSAHQVPLVILEACKSGQLGNLGAFRGVAQALIEAGVGSVIAMSHAVHVEATRILVAKFCEGLARGASAGEALDVGRTALTERPARWTPRGPGEPAVALSDWFLPQLYQSGEDTVLVPGGAANAPWSARAPEVRRPPAQRTEVGAFPKAPRHGFFGRAPELHLLERRFRRFRGVVLHAMGGMGKTSLAREAASWWTTATGLFPDGACFVSFEQAGGAQRAVQVIGAYFEGAKFESRPAEEQRKRARELFNSKRVLVVWDNFESVLPAFQEGEPAPLYGEEEREAVYDMFHEWTGDDEGHGRLLITCRPGKTGLGGAVCKVELEGLAEPDALSMLYEVMEQRGVKETPERAALYELLRTVDMHPLSIELVGPHLKTMTPEAIVTDFHALFDSFEDDGNRGKNRSLRASIQFSLKRLSKPAQDAVRWLGLFRGGVFEEILLDVSEMEPAAWESARAELEATALVKVERDVEMNDKPYLRFHPTLAVAAGEGAVEAGVRQRFVAVHLAVMMAVHRAFFGSNPRWGMEVMVREEANFRRAVDWALEQAAYDRASALGETLAEYLQSAGRLRERDRWVARLAAEVRKSGFSKAVADRERDEAWALLSQGKPREGIEKLKALVTRLRTTTEFDAAITLANACIMLGRIYVEVGWSQKAIPVLKDAAKQWEVLVGKARAAGKSGDDERGNLSAALGDLANALRDAGALDEALDASERAIAIDRKRGDHRSIAAGLGQTAQILKMQGRHGDADGRYDEALQAARRAGDQALEGTLLQQQGGLALERGQLDRAGELYRGALQLFQEMHDDGSVMRTCNSLGIVEQEAGRLAEARAWYERSREMARSRGDKQVFGGVAQNLGVVCQLEGEAARRYGDEIRAKERFTAAVQFVKENLEVAMASDNKPMQGSAHSHLGQIHLLLGDLNKAEVYAHQAREIHERLGLKEAWKDYNTLAGIARARKKPEEAAAWEQKRESLLAELKRRAGAPALPPQIIQGIGRLAVDCAQAGLEGKRLEPGAEEAITTIAGWPAPLDSLAPFLRALAAGNLPDLPAGLPPEITAVLQQVIDAVKAARG